MTVALNNLRATFSDTNIAYSGIQMNVTYTAADYANSSLLKINVNGTERVRINMDGQLSSNGSGSSNVNAVNLIVSSEAQLNVINLSGSTGTANQMMRAAANGSVVWGNPAGLELIAEIQPTTDVANVRFTGLSGYQFIRVDFALQATAAANTQLSCRTSGGTFRSFGTIGPSGAASNRVHLGHFTISNFGISATHKIMNASIGFNAGATMDASNNTLAAIDTSPKASYSSFPEEWDEFVLEPDTGNWEGSSGDQRGRVSVYGIRK